MIAISPATVPLIDRYAEQMLGLPVLLLMQRAGEAVARAVLRRIPKGKTVLILAGCGNNGGDGYAAALALQREGYRALVCDVTGKGQTSEAGRALLAEYRATVGEPLPLTEAAATPADCLVDAILGTGARLPLREELFGAAALLRAFPATRIAVDLPLGADAETGEADPMAASVDETVCLGFLKHGLFSYPARALCGKITCDPIGLDIPEVRERFSVRDRLTTDTDIAPLLPRRAPDSHKGTYGHLLLLAGSHRYRGAALLAAGAALRMGAGLVTLVSVEEVLSAAAVCHPELILAALPSDTKAGTLALAEGKSAILVGPGAGADDALRARLRALLTTEGAPLILDADAITVLSDPRGRALLKETPRTVVLTPHPAEFGRLYGLDTAAVCAERLTLARRFAAEYPHAVLVLKGAGTVVCEGERFAINTSGSPALAKGGSGDVLAGAIASLVAAHIPPYDAARIAVFLHGAAGERLAEHLSPLGVTPSDLPSEMAHLLSEVTA